MSPLFFVSKEGNNKKERQPIFTDPAAVLKIL